MKVSFFTNIAFLFLLVFLVWFTQKATTEDVAETVSELDSSAIQQITIERKTNTLILNKHETNWQLTQPFVAPGNPTRIDLILSVLNHPFSNSKAITEDMDLSIYGLAEPVATLTLDQHVIAFGEIAPLQEKRFVQFNDQLYLLDDTIAPMLTASANSFIDNRLFASDVTITNIQLPGNAYFSLEAGQWQSSFSELSKDDIQTFVDAWQHAAALQVSPVETEDQGEEVLISLKGQSEPMTLLFKQDEHRFTLSDSQKGLAYDFPNTILPTLFPQDTQ